jgi:hypothetical protein
VEGTGPGHGIGHHASPVTHHLASDPLDPICEFGRRATREGHQQYATRIGTVDNQVRDAMGEGVGLSGSGSSDHQQRAPNMTRGRNAVLYRSPLLRI